MAALLSARGHAVVARDLPGHGLGARLPAAYLDRTRSVSFEAEPSPVASITLDDYAASVLATIDALRRAGHER